MSAEQQAAYMETLQAQRRVAVPMVDPSREAPATAQALEVDEPQRKRLKPTAASVLTAYAPGTVAHLDPAELIRRARLMIAPRIKPRFREPREIGTVGARPQQQPDDFPGAYGETIQMIPAQKMSPEPRLKKRPKVHDIMAVNANPSAEEAAKPHVVHGASDAVLEMPTLEVEPTPAPEPTAPAPEPAEAEETLEEEEQKAPEPPAEEEAAPEEAAPEPEPPEKRQAEEVEREDLTVTLREMAARKRLEEAPAEEAPAEEAPAEEPAAEEAPAPEALPQALARAVPVTRLTGTAQQVQDIERSMQVSTPARVVPGPPALPLGQLTPAVIQSFEDRTRVALPAFHERLKPITEGVKVTEDPEGALGYTPDEIRRLQIEADITGERLKLTEQRAARGGDPKKRVQQAASLSRDPTDVPTDEPVPAPVAATALVPAPVQAHTSWVPPAAARCRGASRCWLPTGA